MSMVLAMLARKRRDRLGRRRTRYTDPLQAGRHPFQTFMMLLGLASGVSLLVTRVNPASLDSQLPHWLVYSWYGALIVGSLLALLGAYWPGKYDTALTLERSGLDLSGISAMIYTLAMLAHFGLSALYPACIVIGFGVACLVRARDIGFVFYIAHDRVDILHEDNKGESEREEE